MDDLRYMMFEPSGDAPTMLALMAFIALWGFVACSAALYCTSLGY
jgi:hypothetical protein